MDKLQLVPFKLETKFLDSLIEAELLCLFKPDLKSFVADTKSGGTSSLFACVQSGWSSFRETVPAVNMAEELLEAVDRLQSRLQENQEPRKVTTEPGEADRSRL